MLYLETVLYKFYNLFSFNYKTYYKKNNNFNNSIIQNILIKYNYKHSPDITISNLYIPEDYNNVELELYNLDKKQVFFSNIFAINGCDIISGKDTLANIIINFYGREISKTIIPETYITYLPHHIELFKTHFPEHNNHYILKKNIQRKRGICELYNKNIKIVLETVSRYNYKIIQKYIQPFIIKTNKDTLRLYILISCNNITNHKQMLLYKFGKCVYTGENIISSLTQFPDSLYDLQMYLGKDKYNIIFHNIIRKLFLIFKAFKNEICKYNETKGKLQFQLFGLDILLEKDTLEPYILEFNKQPEMKFKSKYDEILKPKLYQDIFNLLETDFNNYSNYNWININNKIESDI